MVHQGSREPWVLAWPLMASYSTDVTSYGTYMTSCDIDMTSYSMDWYFKANEWPFGRIMTSNGRHFTSYDIEVMQRVMAEILPLMVLL